MATEFSKSYLSKTLEVFQELVVRAGKASLVHYENVDLEVHSKSDDSPLTVADLEADEIICSGLEKAYPEIPIITEERSETHSKDFGDAPFFLVDPIDGTKEFIRHIGDYTINIALINKRRPIAGAVYAPIHQRLFLAAKSLGAFEIIGGSKMRLNPKPANQDKLRGIASRSHMAPRAEEFLETNNIQECIYAGSSLKFCLLAAGEADIYPRYSPTMEWDTAAGHAVLNAVNGTVLKTDGTPLSYAEPNYRNGYFIAAREGVKYRS
ncbi:MAG: 3'(2'),5'-bisphosphate nucleotidase CysQ [Rhizobiaceae bacterium]